MPSAARPAITSAAPALRSGAFTLAPVYLFTPLMIAILLSTFISAPILVSSSTYLKRFSNMLSVTVLVPSAIPKSTAICGCISVGKPGYGSVVTCVCFKCPSDITLTESSNSSTWQPTSNSFAVVASRCFGMTFFTSTLPPAAATANMNVPASI